MYIIGAGGHAKVVLDALGTCSHNIELFDDNPSLSGTDVLGYSVQSLPEGLSNSPFHIAIGNNAARCALSERYTDCGDYYKILHSTSTISASSFVAPGCFVAAMAIVSTCASVGVGSIINHSATVDHDVTVGQFSHIAPGARLLGGCSIGDHVLVGAGSVVLPGLSICHHVIIGAGSVITKNITQSGTYIGTPAIIGK